MVHAHSRKDKKTIFPSEIFEKAFPLPGAQQPVEPDALVMPALEAATPVKAAAADDGAQEEFGAMDEDAVDEAIIADFGGADDVELWVFAMIWNDWTSGGSFRILE